MAKNKNQEPQAAQETLEATPEVSVESAQAEAKVDPRIAELEAQLEAVKAENEELARKANPVAKGEELHKQVRDAYQGGALNHQQIADEFRITVTEVREILGDHDLDEAKANQRFLED